VISSASDDATAIILPDQGALRVTYGSLRRQVRDVANALVSAGVSRGDRVGIALPNGLPVIVSFLAASMAGTAAPLNPGANPARGANLFNELASASHSIREQS